MFTFQLTRILSLILYTRMLHSPEQGVATTRDHYISAASHEWPHSRWPQRDGQWSHQMMGSGAITQSQCQLVVTSRSRAQWRLWEVRLPTPELGSAPGGASPDPALSRSSDSEHLLWQQMVRRLWRGWLSGSPRPAPDTGDPAIPSSRKPRGLNMWQIRWN